MRTYNLLLKICPEFLFDFFEPYLERSEKSLDRSRLAEEDYSNGRVKTIQSF